MGPESLRHTRRTMLEAIKRTAASGAMVPVKVAGSAVPMNIVIPENQDKRYKQYREIKIPSSNAVIIFARDCSGSMDDYKCDIINDMSWWIDIWIRKFYEKVERVYIVHDTEAEEVSEKKFYTYREGGGTMCSSAFKLIDEMIENRFPVKTYNVYIFYYTDGDNYSSDNENLVKILSKFDPAEINLVGITQIMSYGNGVKETIDAALEEKLLAPGYIKTAEITSSKDSDNKPAGLFGYYPRGELSEEERNEQIFAAIRKLLTKEEVAN